MTIGQSRTLANRAFVMDRDCLMEGEAHTHALTRRAACVTRETLNRLSDHTGSGTPLPATQRESDIQNTQGRSFMQERNWARRAFGQLYSALISLFTTFLHRNGVFQFTVVCTPKTCGERLKTNLFRVFYITFVVWNRMILLFCPWHC